MGKIFKTSWYRSVVTAMFAVSLLALAPGFRSEASACGGGMDDFACRPGQAYVMPVKPPPPPPPEPVYTGTWQYQYYFIQTGGTNGFVIVHYNLVCVGGNCAPTSAASTCWITGYGTGPCADYPNNTIGRNL